MGFLLVVLVVLGGGLVLLSHRLAWAPRWRARWVRWVVPTVLVLLTGASFLQFGAGPTFLSPRAARPFVWLGATWLALALYLLLGLLLLWLVTAVVGLFRGGPRREFSARVHRVGVPAVLVGAFAVTGFGLARAEDPVITPYAVRSPDLPASLSATRVAVVTDLHAGPVLSAAFTRKVVERVNAAQPDIVLLAGDLIDGPDWRYAQELAPLADLSAPMGVFAVTGNHEMYSGTIPQWEQAWRELGITVLDNASTVVTRDGASLRVAGVHDWSGVGDFAPDYDAAVAQVAPEDFTLLMAHQPRAALKLDASLVDLQVSGHTHGGQLWPFRQLVLGQQPMIDGEASVNGIRVITSRGAGTWGPPVRLGADPQIPLITLKR